MQMSIEQHWETLKVDPSYEICNEYPYHIRRKDNHKVVSESISSGYPQLYLNRLAYKKHRIIALQFIDNDDPDNKIEVDHINKDRTDYHIANLRWVTSTENKLNITGRGHIKYEYFDEIPDDSIVVDTYETKNGMRYFDSTRYYYYHDDVNDEDVFYGKVADELYRRLHINVTKDGCKVVSCRDINNNLVSVCINKFKRQYDI